MRVPVYGPARSPIGTCAKTCPAPCGRRTGDYPLRTPEGERVAWCVPGTTVDDHIVTASRKPNRQLFGTRFKASVIGRYAPCTNQRDSHRSPPGSTRTGWVALINLNPIARETGGCRDVPPLCAVGREVAASVSYPRYVLGNPRLPRIAVFISGGAP